MVRLNYQWSWTPQSPQLLQDNGKSEYINWNAVAECWVSFNYFLISNNYSKMLLTAPVGCLQYFLTASGEIQSFNYKTEVDGNNPNHLANLNYAICIRVENGYCGIKYSQSTSDPYSFTISNDASGSKNINFNSIISILILKPNHFN